MIRSSVFCAITVATLAASAGSATAQTGVQAGILQCRGAPTASFIVGSVHQLACVFQLDRGPQYRYYGVVRRVGLDIGFTEQSALAWAVFAPTHRIGPGDLSGNYGGLTAGGAIGIGGSANAMVGGSNNGLALQPLSLEGQTGLNVAVGIAGLELRYAGGRLHREGRRSHYQENAPSFGSMSGQHARTAEQRKTPVPQLNLGQQAPRPSGEAFPLGASLTGAAEGASVVIDGLADGSTVTAGQSLGTKTWRIPVSDLSQALVQPPIGYAGSMDVMLELRLADDTLLDRKPLRLEWAAVAPPQINAVTPPPPDLKQMFEQFVENYAASTGQRTFSAREREILFAKFQQFLDRK
jgi:hypothetical protein